MKPVIGQYVSGCRNTECRKCFDCNFYYKSRNFGPGNDPKTKLELKSDAGKPWLRVICLEDTSSEDWKVKK